MKLDVLPLTLLHGTSSSALDSILRDGITPRGKDGKRNNWKHTVGSNQRAVYLSNTYAFHFAVNACNQDQSNPVLVEVVVDRLPESTTGYHRLCADEDAVEQSMRGNDKLPAEWDMKRRNIYYRQRMHMYRALDSINIMGTCSYRGVVPATAILRYCVIPRSSIMRYTLGAFDPTVSILNYGLMAERHTQFHQWLMGDAPECAANPYLTRDGITVHDIQLEPA